MEGKKKPPMGSYKPAALQQAQEVREVGKQMGQVSKKPYSRDDYIAVGKIFDTLKRTNAQTLAAQKVMNKYGFNLEEDGFYGPETDKATKKFVSNYGLDYIWEEMKGKVENLFE